MVFCKELKKNFDSRKAMIAELVKNKQIIMDAKKAAIKDSEPIFVFERGTDGAEKTEPTDTVKYELGDTIYPVINTTNYLDSHGDVHAKDIWNKSAKDQDGKIYYIINHDLEIGSIIATPKDVKVELRTLAWSALGKEYKGNTTALVYGVKLTDLAPDQFMKLLRAGHPIENSVRMQYVSLSMCVDDPEYKDEYANWQQYIGEVANRKEAEELGYFWYIREAKIVKEGSAVLFGSNDVTPILTDAPTKQETIVEPLKDTQVVNSKYSYYNLIHN